MSQEEERKESYNIRVSLEDVMATRFKVVKDFYGLKKNADTLRLLVTLAYERIVKVNNAKDDQTAIKKKK